MPKAKGWNDTYDAELTRLYVKELVAIGQIARRMKRSDHSVRLRIAHLKLERSPVEFQAQWDARREKAKACVMAAAAMRPDEIPNRDEEHWRRCQALGGFNVLQINYPPRRAA